MDYTDTSLAPIFITLILGFAKFALVFIAFYIPFEALIRAFSFRSIWK